MLRRRNRLFDTSGIRERGSVIIERLGVVGIERKRLEIILFRLRPIAVSNGAPECDIPVGQFGIDLDGPPCSLLGLSEIRPCEPLNICDREIPWRAASLIAIA